jgi:hypothetical protein
MPAELKPAWHFKCLQSTCPSSKTSEAAKESCVKFSPPAARALEVAGKVKPNTKKVVILSDGSSFASKFVADFNALTDADRKFYCGGCTSEVRQVNSVAELAADPAVSLTGAAAKDVFLMVPSIEKLGGTDKATDVWNAMKMNEAGELVPEAVMRAGGLTAMHQDYAVSAQNCGFGVAGRETLTSGPDFQELTSSLAAFTINADRGEQLDKIRGDIIWMVGTNFQ